ncbi:hypothetical protein [Chitinophaga sp. RAB17]|uniref:hypothetical protein n=1 Tax=Chitinophaga sp. RAB17 TaxID=3233049 RepID=UPI003F8EE208
METTGSNENEDIWTSGFIPFTTSREEMALFATRLGEVMPTADTINVDHYLFQPSIAYQQTTFAAKDIRSIDLTSSPPTIQIGNELIFAPAIPVKTLKAFANTHQIPIVRRTNIWSWILEPFLDTPYSAATDQLLTRKLEELGLSDEFIYTLRQEVKMQMLKYNFDTTLWEWVSLDLLDVLKAMWAKYTPEQFGDFYRRAMAIALLADK